MFAKKSTLSYVAKRRMLEKIWELVWKLVYCLAMVLIELLMCFFVILYYNIDEKSF